MGFGFYCLLFGFWVVSYIASIFIGCAIFSRPVQEAEESKPTAEDAVGVSKAATFATVLSILFTVGMYFYHTRLEISAEDYVQYEGMKVNIQKEQDLAKYQKYDVKKIFGEFEKDGKISKKELSKTQQIHDDMKNLFIEASEIEREKNLKSEMARIKSTMKNTAQYN